LDQKAEEDLEKNSKMVGC